MAQGYEASFKGVEEQPQQQGQAMVVSSMAIAKIDETMELFQSLRSQTFLGIQDPVIANDQIKHLKEIFEGMNSPKG